MKDFIDEDFLLESPTARKLYHEHSERLPIIDYHCHLDPKMIAEDHQFSTITELWLGGDHYKWRLLRANGVDEKFITGDASDWDKFEKWAQTIPYTMRNPIYHWTHLELKRVFGIDELLKPETARAIYDKANELLQQPDYSARSLMKKFNVEVVCTTDDPCDDLQYHRVIKESGFKIKVLPTWRPDKAMAIENIEEFHRYIKKLEQSSGLRIERFSDYLEAIKKRHDYFAANGCLLADHGIDNFYSVEYTDEEIDSIFEKVINLNQTVNSDEVMKFKSKMLYENALMHYEKGWVQQFHYGALRNNNSRMFKLIGADTGYDSINDPADVAESLSKFFDKLERDGKLAKSIIYNLNPVDNYLIATMIGNFQDGSYPGKIQFGSGWWFLDQKNGIEAQLNILSTQGLLSRFVGMLTDSRSFISYPRHEYFRRILCNLVGSDLEKGLLPKSEIDFIGTMVENISYFNALNYFDF